MLSLVCEQNSAQVGSGNTCVVMQSFSEKVVVLAEVVKEKVNP